VKNIQILINVGTKFENVNHSF